MQKGYFYSQIAVNRREVKGKGEKEIYTHLKPQLQRIAMRDKKERDKKDKIRK